MVFPSREIKEPKGDVPVWQQGRMLCLRSSCEGSTLCCTDPAVPRTVKTPVNVCIDNVGAIFMTKNMTSSSRNQHMDARWWHVTQLQEEDKLIKVQFVRTKVNISEGRRMSTRRPTSTTRAN